MFSLICVWINGWVNNREAGNLRRHRCHYDIIVMLLCTCRWGNHLLLGIRQPKQNIPNHLPRSLEDIMLSVQFISTQNVWLQLIKMLTMSGDHWWLILPVPETVLVNNNLHCFKLIPTHCNSFAGNVSRMWLNIHSAWAQDLGQLAEAWWMTSIWRSNRKVVIKQCI